jgi:3-hydroxymyristoyl/3-hydroxydecanoyl-(acyl carrier protein) dehydratase
MMGRKKPDHSKETKSNNQLTNNTKALLFRFLRAQYQLNPTMPFLPTYFTEEPFFLGCPSSQQIVRLAAQEQLAIVPSGSLV